jgi:hypothetical protein
MDIEIGKLVILAVVFVFLILEVLNYFKGIASKSWTGVKAVVIEAKIQAREVEGAEESRLAIKYEYKFHGSSYVNNRFTYGNVWSSNYRESLEKLKGKHVGSEIRIFVNPIAPNKSVVLSGYNGSILWNLVFFIAALVVVFMS